MTGNIIRRGYTGLLSIMRLMLFFGMTAIAAAAVAGGIKIAYLGGYEIITGVIIATAGTYVMYMLVGALRGAK